MFRKTQKASGDSGTGLDQPCAEPSQAAGERRTVCASLMISMSCASQESGSWSRTDAKISSARSRCSRSWVAITLVRIREPPGGTAG
jgi:hypothetical protein